MIEQRKISDKLTELYTDEGFLHRVGTEGYYKRICVPEAKVGDFEWVSDKPKFTRDEYERKVEELIRGRYSVSQELAILRQRDAKSEEFAEYDAFAEECKREAKAELAEQEKEMEE